MHVTITPEAIVILLLILSIVVKFVKSHTNNIRVQAAMNAMDAAITAIQTELSTQRTTQEKTLANSVPASVIAATISAATSTPLPASATFIGGTTLKPMPIAQPDVEVPDPVVHEDQAGQEGD